MLIGSSSNSACGNERARYVRIATFSVSTPSSVRTWHLAAFTFFTYSGASCLRRTTARWRVRTICAVKDPFAYEESIHLPFYLVHPDVKRGQDCRSLTGHTPPGGQPKLRLLRPRSIQKVAIIEPRNPGMTGVELYACLI
jgi:hypothetical protein